MANNRIYLRCKNCNEKLFLGKRLGEGYWLTDYPNQEPFMKRINEFYDKHTFCGEYQDCFDICYESEPLDLLDNIEMARQKILKCECTPGTLHLNQKHALELLSYFVGMDVQIEDNMPKDRVFHMMTTSFND